MKNSGSYILILKLERDKKIKVGSLGYINFKKGYYFYCGSGKKNLHQRIERHKRKNKKLFWHIDYLREKSEYICAIIFDKLTECQLAEKLKNITDGSVNNFGCSDCKCNSHLFYSERYETLNLTIDYKMYMGENYDR